MTNWAVPQLSAPNTLTSQSTTAANLEQDQHRAVVGALVAGGAATASSTGGGLPRVGVLPSVSTRLSIPLIPNMMGGKALAGSRVAGIATQ